MRALLLANATVATLTGRRANSPASQGSPAMGRRLRHPTTALAPWIISRRMYPSPRFEIRPRRSLPPLDRCCGTSPSQAANCRPDLNWVASPTVATIALAVIGPTPGMVASRRLTSFARCQAISSPSTTATRAATSRSWSARTAACVGLTPAPSLRRRAAQAPVDVAHPLAHDHAEFSEVRSNGADQAAALSDQKVAGSVEQENGLLVGPLTGTNRMVGRCTALQIASASAASFFWLL